MKLLDKIKGFFSKVRRTKKFDDLKMLNWEEEYYSENRENFKSGIKVKNKELIQLQILNSENWIKNMLMYLGLREEIANNPIVLKNIDEFLTMKFEDVCVYSECKNGNFSNILELIKLLKDEGNVFYYNGLVLSNSNDSESDILEIKKIEEGLKISKQHIEYSKMGTTTINEFRVYNNCNILMKRQKSTTFCDNLNSENDYKEEKKWARDISNPFLIYENFIKNKGGISKRTDIFKAYYYKNYISKTCINLDEVGDDEQKEKIVFKKDKQGIKDFFDESILHTSKEIKNTDLDKDTEEMRMFCSYCRKVLSEISK